MVHLNGIVVHPGDSTVTAGAGATLEAILQRLEDNGLGWACVPAPGVLSIAGALAVDAHGAALPAVGESPPIGTTYGSLSNLITSLTAVVWDGTAYSLRTFDRSEPAILPLLAHLGRTFLTSVTLQASANTRMRCQSYTDIGWREMFGVPGAPGRTFESFLDQTGRAEAIWYPFTENPWLKVWSISPDKPPTAREVTGPYNYPFSDNLPEIASDLIGQLTAGNTFIAPAFGQVFYGTTVAGLAAFGSYDLWGWAKDLQFYIKPSTLLLTEGGGAVITSRSNVAQVVHDFTVWFEARVAYYQSIGQYPINGPVEIRCCGMDDPPDLRDATPTRPPRVGHSSVAQRARSAEHTRHVRVLSRDGAVDARALLRSMGDVPPRMVQGLGFQPRTPLQGRRGHRVDSAEHLPSGRPELR